MWVTPCICLCGDGDHNSSSMMQKHFSSATWSNYIMSASYGKLENKLGGNGSERKALEIICNWCSNVPIARKMSQYCFIMGTIKFNYTRRK